MTLEQAANGTSELRDFARALGLACLSVDRNWLAGAARDPRIARTLGELTECVARAEHAWQSGDSFAALLDEPAVREGIGRLSPVHLLPELGVLRGLCAGPLGQFFRNTASLIELDRGDPFPVPDRPRPPHDNPTPPFPTTDANAPLVNQGFRIWEHPPLPGPAVRLDYRWRAELDAVSWDDDAGVPRLGLASVHPYADFGELGYRQYGGYWFDVGPRDFDRDAVLRALAKVADADAAVLPELSLPEPWELGAALALEHERYPALVVAGSAHLRTSSAGEEVRANESNAYANGIRIVVHRKSHPLKVKVPGSETSAPQPEGLTGEPKPLTLASSGRTRLAVVICADLIDDAIPQRLVAAGVNYLLVPALSSRPGSFSGAAGTIASYCQGYAAIVNGAPLPDEKAPDPFMVIAAVPVDDSDEQVRSFPAPTTGRRAIGRFDLSKPLSGQPDWLSYDAGP